MNSFNFPPQKPDYTLKRSTILEQYNSQTLPSSHDRNSVTKRSSFTLIHQYPPQPMQQPKTPKSSNNYPPYNIDKVPVPNQYYHHSNYINNQPYPYQQHNYPLQSLPTNRSETSINRI